ncbi:TetR/AcrR family transcriptional regulator [Fructobacillus parabroussonetiae]|uniref:TetR/AcrR family transcriptional regulator n=1 Tax=Fructobacillus parabroussonetiae TaxID=2713174 RepID=A0ABS5QV09_9LACO|nr:TetR/AcrR family transcriptional regulator [Fructobacillus parabroussonetiae]MBS9337038.1 TetR/AcrR family transcriptional regulator [Fructobacillus parabroussonetiae]
MANKTYTLMHEHLLDTTGDLLTRMPFSKITVKHICEKAEVNRNTFYRHFDDKFDLLDVIIKEAMQVMSSQIDLESFHQAPFATINEFTFQGSLSILDFQLKDKVFEEQFYNAVFKELTAMAPSSDILWLLGNMQVIRIWNSNLKKPYSFQADYKLFDKIIREKKFPGIDD